MAATIVLYDGWPLVREADSPAARHLLTILSHLPDGIQAVVALPEQAPREMQKDLEVYLQQIGKNEGHRLRWEQQMLPTAAKTVGAAILHTTAYSAPLFSRVRVVSSPAGYDAPGSTGKRLAARLRTSLGRGGFARSAQLLWPSDLPAPKITNEFHHISPVTHPDYIPIPIGEQKSPAIPGVEIPETYTIYHGPGNETALRNLLQAWTWAAGPIGEYFPLLLVGLSDVGKSRANLLIREFEVTETVRILPAIGHQYLVKLYQNCSALFHPAALSPWGDPVRHALACGRPVVAWEEENSDAVAGAAAFLVETGNLRAFGAAMISVVVKDSLYEQLGEKAIERAKAWKGEGFYSELGKILSASVG